MPSPFRRICLLTSAVLVSTAVPAAAQTTTAITPTAYWNFDTDAKDSSGNGHHGTVVSVNNKVTFTKVTGEFVRGTGALKIDNDSAVQLKASSKKGPTPEKNYLKKSGI